MIRRSPWSLLLPDGGLAESEAPIVGHCVIIAGLVVCDSCPEQNRSVVGRLVPPPRTHSNYEGRIPAPDGLVWCMQALPDRLDTLAPRRRGPAESAGWKSIRLTPGRVAA